MTSIVDPVPTPDGEFEGLGSSLDAAVFDALNIASRQREGDAHTDLEVMTWGIRSDGIGDTYAFWVRMRTKARKE